MNDQKKVETTEFFFSLLYELGIPILIAIAIGIITASAKFDASQIWLITGIGFIAPLLVVDIVKRERKESSGGYIKRQHFIDKSIGNADDVISSILMHFAEDCYNRCSNLSNRCADCKNFARECNGLLRNYLYETCRNLQESIIDTKKGKFNLNTNIEKFHTIAVEHLTGYGCTSYSVIQWINPDAPSSENAGYDGLDYDFLSVLLQEITDLHKKNDPESSYYKQHNFKIRWLLIGNLDDIQNNYDYIFWVIDHLNLYDKAKDIFNFYHITENEYHGRNTANFNNMSDFVKGIFRREPSLGIFGDYFMFVDADNKSGKHGTIFTKLYKDSSADRISAVQESLEFYNKLINVHNKIAIDDIYMKYKALPDEHRNRTLKDRSPKVIK